MKKFGSKQGYTVYKVRREQLALIGGLGICDECNDTPDFGYLVPVLNHYQCPKCFEEWNNNHSYYYDDIDFQNKYAKIYEDRIGYISCFYQYVINYGSDFVSKSILEAAATQGGSLDDAKASHYINFLCEVVKRLPLPKDQRKSISAECKRLLKEYKEFYLD